MNIATLSTAAVLLFAAAAPLRAAPTLPDIEKAVLAGDYKDAGAWERGKFKNADLQRLLEELCKKDKIDPNAAPKGVQAKKAGGDLETTVHADLPAWYTEWRVRISSAPKWDNNSAVRSRIGEAFSRAFFRKLAKQKGLAYPPAADEHFAQLWKSNANKKSPDLGGPGAIFCAAAASVALTRAINSIGYAGTKAGTQICKATGNLKAFPPKPGDVISLVSPGTPRTGHVATIVAPLTDTWDQGQLWVVSGNTSPGGTVAVDFVKLEKKDPGFNPFLILKGEKAPTLKWRPVDKKPSAGTIWVYSKQECSAYLPASLEGKTAVELSKLNLRKIKPKTSPGSTPGKVR